VPQEISRKADNILKGGRKVAFFLQKSIPLFLLPGMIKRKTVALNADFTGSCPLKISVLTCSSIPSIILKNKRRYNYL
jgi:hypothetical protein